MALQLRRGTNRERLGITPSQGEIIFVVDSQLAFTNVITITGGSLVTSSAPHKLLVGDAVKFIDNSERGFVENAVYYVLSDGLTDTAFKLSLTKNGVAITTFTSGEGLTLRLAVGPTDVYGIPFGYSINPLWVGDAATVGGLPAGASTLDELSDVDIGIHDLDGIPLDAFQHLEYDGATNTWRNVSSMVIPPTYVDHNGATQSTVLDVRSTTDSTSSTTGAIKTAGGLGVGKALYVGTVMRVGSSTDSTTKDTGALVVQNGGLGVEKAIVAGTSITAGTSLAAGTSLSVGTSGTVGTDLTVGGDLAVNGGDITSTSGVASLFNTGVTTLNIGGSSSTINTGGQLNVGGDIKVGGGDIRSSDGVVNMTLTSNTLTTFAGDIKVNGNTIQSSTGVDTIQLSNSDVTILGDLKITGNDIISSSNQTAITLSGTDVSMPNLLTVANEVLLTGSQPFVSFNTTNSQDGVNTIRGIRGNVSLDDKWFVGAGSSGDDDGYLMLAISDNGNDPGTGEKIIVRKYGGSGTAHATPWDVDTPIVAELELLGVDSNTRVPNKLYVGSDLIVDTNTLIVDATANKIGIGGDVDTSYRVNVTGGIQVSGDININGGEIRSDVSTFGILPSNVSTINIGSTTSVSEILSTVESSSQTTGALKVAGGVGIVKHLHVGGSISVDNTNTSTDVYSGSIQTDGGLGVVGTSHFGGMLSVHNSAVVDVDLSVGGNLTVTGDLTVNGTTTTLNTNTLEVEDKNIVIAKGVTTSAAADGAGITVGDGAGIATFNYQNSTTRWVASTGVNMPGALIGNVDIARGGDDNTITTSSGNLILDAATNTIQVNADITQVGTLTNDGIVVDNITIGVATDNTITATIGDLVIASENGDILISPEGQLTVGGPTTINGYTLITSDLEVGDSNIDNLSINAQVDTDLVFRQPTTGIRGVVFNTGNNDYAGIRGGQIGSDQGYLEIATGDNGTEPIYVRQYSTGGNFAAGTSPTRTLKLLDESGNTVLPGNLTLGSNGYIYSSTDLALDLTGANVRVVGNLDVGSYSTLSSFTLTTSTTTANQVLNSFDVSTGKTAKYIVQATSGSDIHVFECLVMHNGTTAYITTYGEMMSNSSLTTVSADISGSLVRLLVTPTNASTVYKVTKTSIAA